MFKLMVVSGPNRGAAYSVNNEGETSIGRQSGNNVMLHSSRVSKRHCVLVASNGELLVKDQGSSNGTFVNGVLAKEKKIKGGDRISVGEFVFEVVESKSSSNQGIYRGLTPVSIQRPSGLTNNVLAFPSGGLPASESLPGMAAPGAAAEGIGDVVNGPVAPKSLKEKASWAFEHYVMPFFYGWSLKNEWRLICIGVFAAFCFVNMFVSVSPLLESSHRSIIRESGRRADYMARQIADAAAPLVAARAESRVNVSAAADAAGVKLAVVTDLDNRIIAPSTRQNEYLTEGAEALVAIRARNLFRRGRQTGVIAIPDSNTIVAVEPLRVYNQATDRNTVIGMAIVSIDTTLATMGLGDVGLVYSETLIITALLGAFMLLILYRLTLKPLQVLGEDMDKALKGDLNQVTHEFRWQELNPLWDLINSALQRIPKSMNGFGGTGKVETPLGAEDFAGPLRAFAALGNMGVVICDGDRKIVSMNSHFEELTGIRGDSSVGQDMSSAARDQAFAALVSDLFDRVQPGSEGLGEEFDFSGIGHQVQAFAFGGMTGVKCYILVACRRGEGGG